MPKVVVFGSACVDVLMNPETLPRPGNTVLAKTYVLLPGGKGANQACACAMASRDGGEDEDEEEDGDASEKASKKAKTAKTKAAKAAKAAKIKTEFVGAVGADAFGEILKKTFAEAGVGITGLATHVSLPTAVASVVVDAHGENQIAVGSGANLSVSAKRLSNISRTLGTNTFTLHKNDVLLLQMEIPVAEVADAVALAHTVGAFSVLNVAPSAPVPIAALEKIDFLVVNEHEAIDVIRTLAATTFAETQFLEKEIITALQAAQHIATRFQVAVVVTLGADGACACLPIRPGGLDESGGESRDSCDVISVAAAKLLTGETIKDTTGAGDAFCGAFVHALASGLSLPACLQRASVAGTVGCLAVGARTSVPDGETLSRRQNSVEVTANWGSGNTTTKEQALFLFNAPGTAWTRTGRRK